MQATPIPELDHRPPASGRAGRLGRRTKVIALALIGVGTALYFGWDRLAAAGVASLIVGFLPCAIMCGLGLCASRLMGRGGTSGCHARAADGPTAASTNPAEPVAKLTEATSRVSA